MLEPDDDLELEVQDIMHIDWVDESITTPNKNNNMILLPCFFLRSDKVPSLFDELLGFFEGAGNSVLVMRFELVHNF
jgi:hypothetical protein